MEDNIVILDDIGALIAGDNMSAENKEDTIQIGDETNKEVSTENGNSTENPDEVENQETQPKSEEEFKESEEVKDKDFQENVSNISGSRGLTKFAKSMIESGEWEDLIIETEKGDVKLSEMKSLTQEQISAVYSEQKKIREEKFKEDFTSIKDLPEYKKEIIAIIKEGGKDLVEAIRNDSTISTPPFQDVDLENVNSRATVYLNDLVSKGLSKEDAITLVKSAEAKGELINKAEEIVAKANETYLGELKRIKEEIAEENKEIGRAHV